MMIIPLSKKFSWRNPPIVTIVLIVLNVLVFVLFQRHDSEHYYNAQRFYFESGLAKLEFNLYKLYAKQQEGAHIETSGGFTDDSQGHDTGMNRRRQRQFLRDMEGKTEFRKQIAAGAILPVSDRRVERWHELYPEYRAQLEEATFFAYGFIPAEHRAVTWFTSMFLHGGWGHLIGNMVFLWVIGCMIEYGCRHITFPLIYVLGGLCASGLFWILNSDSSTPCVGASGAISGIMGAFTILYGFKKVRLFLNLGFYFNNVTFPAILILPAWILKEVYGMVYNTGSSTAFAAHLGGLVGGALLALAARQIPGLLAMEDFAAADESEAMDKGAPLLEQALAHMRKLEYDQARPILMEIIGEEPQRIAAWEHVFTIDRQNPQTPEFHHTAATLLDLLGREVTGHEKAIQIFETYLKLAKPPRLQKNMYLLMAQLYINAGNLKQAQRLIVALVKQAPQLPALPAAIYKLAQGLQKDGQTELARRCVILLQRHYPDARTTRIAVAQLASEGQIPAR